MASKKATTKAASTKTQKGVRSFADFLASLDDSRRADCEQLDRWMAHSTRDAATMYGASIVGYGTKDVPYADGTTRPWMRIGFAPRAQAIALYGVVEHADAAWLQRLGKHTVGGGCLYIKRISDVDGSVLAALIDAAAGNTRKG
jgi:hypothetical protein